MKNSQFAIAIAVLLLATNLHGQDFYGFQKILKGPTHKRGTTFKPNKFKADIHGGVLLMTMPDTSEKKQGVYEFRWRFIDDISRLEPGKKYKFEMVGRRISGNAEKNTNTAWMSSSNMGGKLVKDAGIESLANSLSVKKSKSKVVAWPIQDNNVATGTIEVEGKPTLDQTYFTFKFDFDSFPFASNSKACSFEVVYVYGKNSVPAGSDLPDSGGNSVFETYRSSDNQRFHFKMDGDSLTGIYKVEGIGSTSISAKRVVLTVLDRNGRTSEVTGFEGTFVSTLNSGRRISGTTTIMQTANPDELQIISSFVKDGKQAENKIVVKRASIFNR